MRAAYNVLSGVETAELVIIGLAALLLRWRSRSAAQSWLAATFGVLGVVVVAGQFLPQHPHGAWETFATRLLVAGIVLFPYLLYRFTLAIRRDHPRAERIAGLVTAAIVAWSFALPSFPDPNATWPTYVAVYVVAVLLQWSGISGLVAVRLWRAGRGQPTVARRRMRSLALAAGCLLGILLLSVALNPHGNVNGRSIFVQALAVVVIPLFPIGFAPPGFLVTLWRQAEANAMRAGTIDLLRATTVEDIGQSLLPRVTDVIGGHGAAILSRSGTVLHSHGITDDTRRRLVDAARTVAERAASEAAGAGGVLVEGDMLWAGTDHLWLVVNTTSYMPFFGTDDATMLASVAALADLAVGRVEHLQREREQVDAAREFVAIASHDLRTPTTAITGFADLLHRRWATLPEAERRRMAAAIHRQGRQLSALIEDILTISRIDAAAVAARPASVNVAAAARQLITDLGIPDVTVEVASDVSAWADPDHLNRILTNYLRNAQVYGAPPLRIGARRVGDTVEISVADCGRGVPPSFVPRLWDRFARAEGKTTSAVAGTGLGLSIVAGLAKSAGGRAWYRPVAPTGAEFGVTLPATSATPRIPLQSTREEPWISVESS